MDIFHFILGVIFGASAVIVGISINVHRSEYKKYVLPFKKLIGEHISSFTFNTRVANLVYFNHKDYTVVLNLKEKEVYLYQDTTIIATTFKENTQEVKHLYTLLETAYHADIYLKIITASNGVVMSQPKETDVSKKEKEHVHTPSVDDILDKISKDGMDSLSEIELEILKNNSDD